MLHFLDLNFKFHINSFTRIKNTSDFIKFVIGDFKMGYLDGLKVIAASRPANLSPTLQRRSNLLNKLGHQFECAKAKSEGSDYFVQSFKSFKLETGQREQVEWQRRIKPWWYITPEGKVIFEVRYANKRIELQKGKTGIEVDNLETLIPAIELLKKAVENGELDSTLSNTAKTIRSEIAK